MAQRFQVHVLDDQEFDKLPYIGISDSLGIADPKSNQAFIRRTGIAELDLGTISHELDHLISKNTDHMDEYGIQHKKGGFFKNIIAPVLGVAGTFLGLPTPLILAASGLGAVGTDQYAKSNHPEELGAPGNPVDILKTGAIGALSGFGAGNAASGALSGFQGAAGQGLGAQLGGAVKGALGFTPTSSSPSLLTPSGPNPFAQAGTSIANGPVSLAGANPFASGASALGGFGVPSLASSTSASLSAVPSASATQSSGLKNAFESFNKVNNVANTLSPNTAPISGAGNDAGGGILGGGSFGNVNALAAFGGNELGKANPGGPRIDQGSFDSIVNRLNANNYLQNTQARDQFNPAGQFESSQNTPYAGRLSEIDKGYDQTYKDLVSQANNYNKYYDVLDTNSGVTPDQLNTYLTGQGDQGVLGNFSIDPTMMEYLKSIKPIQPFNSSLIT